jgi:hypothetical protein
LSRFNSATSFFSRAFSSRSCFTSCASLTSMPPYFSLQAWIVCLEIPYSRPTSSILRPASTCFKATIIWASVCRLAPMPSPSSRPKSYLLLDGFGVRLGLQTDDGTTAGSKQTWKQCNVGVGN